MIMFEVHTMTTCNDDLGTMILENGELAVYDDRKTAQKMADGMNYLRKMRGSGLVHHDYVVVKREVQND